MKRRSMGRTAGGGALLVLLAASGYLGAETNAPAQAVSVPIVFEPLEEGAMASQTTPESGESLAAQRERALAMLEEVIDNPRVSQKAAQDALEQKTQIAENMESEARLEEMLTLLGIRGAQAIAGEGMLTVFAPAEAALDDKARVQIVDAAATATGLPADRIKIILAKNE